MTQLSAAVVETATRPATEVNVAHAKDDMTVDFAPSSFSADPNSDLMIPMS